MIYYFSGTGNSQYAAEQLAKAVNNHNAFMNINLGGRQAHTGGVIHGFSHVLDELANSVVHLFNRFGHFVQTWIGKMKNR